ncbi:hypothetical protein K440DRAFT_663912 [Wilcoxina mikolae CBS 423.85]|nr:hypothetical protein K440DRAFT_663912 [Wilcoxina mikolae CBS 423.85]
MADVALNNSTAYMALAGTISGTTAQHSTDVGDIDEGYCDSAADSEGEHSDTDQNGSDDEKDSESWPGLAELVHKTQQHKKMSMHDRNLLLRIIGAPNDGSSHIKNSSSKWFGVSIKPAGVSLRTTSRYRELSMATDFDKQQYPCLISVVGETGSGKSTLIGALIKSSDTTSKSFETPIQGDPTHLDTPTSGDVHLFPDPATSNTARPCLYADCEGLQGGSNDPIAIQEENIVTGKGVFSFKGQRFHIKWAIGAQRSRGWMVQSFYPRILFTFSDVVVYVSKNFRTIETIISQMLQWAETVLQKSVNQPMLPYAIIVINALDAESTEPWWKDNITDVQLDKYAKCIETDPILMELVKYWGKRNKPIATLRELILCYYSGIKMICIPHMKSTSAAPLLIKQYKKLHGEIQNAMIQTRKMRIEAELLMDSEELNIYLGDAFDHFSSEPSRPFNFLSAAFARNPVRTAFGARVVDVATRLMRTRMFEAGRKVFKELAPLIASTILLDVCRKNCHQKFNAGAEVIEEYNPFCASAIEEFYRSRWPCSYKASNGECCVNVASKHQKGHQLANGKIDSVGSYYHGEGYDPLDEDKFLKEVSLEFVDAVSSDYKGLHASLMKEQTQSCSAGEGRGDIADYDEKELNRSEAAKIHRDILGRDSYIQIWNRVKDPADPGIMLAQPSHSTCFGCLSSAPDHVLRCGHVICEKCVDDFADIDGLRRTLHNCPLCPRAREVKSSNKAQLTMKKEPWEAAPRILCLDGGGVRSIIQTTILAELEKKIDLGLPIQEFFDLIVGTSAGGIVALGMGVGRMSANQASELINQYAKTAFTKRTGFGIPGVRHLVEAVHHGRFETSGLNDVLKRSFSEQGKLFGHARSEKELKVGVTLTSSSGYPYFVANYNRPTLECAGYEFLRAEDQSEELEVWEAARGTSAAPRFFKPFYHEPTRRLFADGGLTFNNPAHIAETERKILWRQHTHPDIFLSIGTGAEIINRNPERQRSAEVGGGPMAYVKSLKVMVTRLIDHNLNSQNAWDDFVQKLPESEYPEKKNNYVRLNLEFPGNVPKPKLHRVKDLEQLKCGAKEFCETNEALMKSTAHKIIASLFYVRLDGASNEENGFHLKGSIRCRMEPNTEPLQKICIRFIELAKKLGGPVFTIKTTESEGGEGESVRGGVRWPTDVDGKDPAELSIDFEVNDIFMDDAIRIYLASGEPEVPPALISGFPSSLAKLRRLQWGK